MTDAMSEWGPVIFEYSRAQAIADGVLIDVTEEATPLGFIGQVCVTATVMATLGVGVDEAVRGERLRLLLLASRGAAGRFIRPRQPIVSLPLTLLIGVKPEQFYIAWNATEGWTIMQSPDL